MADSPNKLTRFWQELKRRKVIYVITVYASAAFVMIELVNNVLEPLNLPEKLPSIVIITLVVAFPVVVILSWVFDVTPKGLERTKPVEQVSVGEKMIASNSWRITTYVSVVIIAGLVVFNIVTRTNIRESLIEYGKSIAVLPFINDSPDPENEYFINGAMEAILNNLCLVKDLRVISRTSVEQYRDTVVPIPEIAKAMMAGYILEGSMQKIGKRIRLTVQLIDQHDRHLWSEHYDREIEQVEQLFDLQSEIAQQVAKEIKAVITPEEMQRIKKIPTHSDMAYQLWQKGYQSFLQAMNYRNPEDFKRAKSFFQQALSYDSLYVDAFVGLGKVYFWSERAPSFEIKLDSILRITDVALSLDDQNEWAYILRSRYYWTKGERDKELNCYNRILEVNPNNAVAFVYRANCYHFLFNDYLNAIKNYEAADLRQRGELLSVSFYNLYGMAYKNAGFPDLANNIWQKFIPFDDDSAYYFQVLGNAESDIGNYKPAIECHMNAYRIDSTKIPSPWNFCMAGRTEEALMWTKKTLQKYPMRKGLDMAYILNESGETEEAGRMFSEIIGQYKTVVQQRSLGYIAGDLHLPVAQVYAYQGEKEKAYEVLEDLIALRNSFYIEKITVIKHSPMFNSLRGEERFENLVRTMESRWQAEHAKLKKWLEKEGRI